MCIRVELAHTGPDVSGRLLNFFSPIKGDVLGQKPIGVIKGREKREREKKKQHNPGGLFFSFFFFLNLVAQSR